MGLFTKVMAKKQSFFLPFFLFFSFARLLANDVPEKQSFTSEPLSFAKGEKDSKEKVHILFLMHKEAYAEAISAYQALYSYQGREDFDLLQKMALIAIENGSKSSDREVLLLSLFGAGITSTPFALDILEKGLTKPDLELQLISLYFISKIADDGARALLNKAMHSEFLPVRMEAAYALAVKKDPKGLGQIEALMHRLPPSFKIYFPPLFALIGTPDAMAILHEFLHDLNSAVRAETILSIAHYERDDFLPFIRKRIEHAPIGEQEACAFALGILKDSSSIKTLKRLCLSSTESVKLAAAYSLFLLGDNGAKECVEKLAKKGNLFAIALLGKMENSEKLLSQLLLSKDLQIRINAALSLLQRKNRLSLPVLKEVFLRDIRGLAFSPCFSLGKALSAWKAFPSAEQLSKKEHWLDLDLSLSLREHFLQKTIELAQKDFLSIAHEICKHNQKDLIPMLMSLLENNNTPETLSFLKYEAEKAGAPLLRDYCQLALFHLKEPKAEEYIFSRVLEQNKNTPIRLRPFLPWKNRLKDFSYQLSPEESSHLLMEMYASLAKQKNTKAINAFLEGTKIGYPKNRYVLFGLLFRSLE